MLSFGADRVWVDRVFDSCDVIALDRLYDTCEPEYVKQLHNLFHVEFRRPSSSDAKYFYDKLESHAKRKVRNFYFLEYSTGSWARKHADDSKQSGLTAITMLYRSNDLVGGDTVVYLPYEDMPAKHENSTNRGLKVTTGQEIVPSMVTLSVGETAFYTTQVAHEVTLVHNGIRRVLVTWFHPE